jgi:hypothetical protein
MRRPAPGYDQKKPGASRAPIPPTAAILLENAYVRSLRSGVLLRSHRRHGVSIKVGRCRLPYRERVSILQQFVKAGKKRAQRSLTFGLQEVLVSWGGDQLLL